MKPQFQFFLKIFGFEKMLIFEIKGQIRYWILLMYNQGQVHSIFCFEFLGHFDQKTKKSAVIFRQNADSLYRKQTNRTAEQKME